MLSGVAKITLTNQSTGAQIVLRKIAAESSFEINQPVAAEQADGGAALSGAESKAEIISYDTEHYSTLENWMSDENEIMFEAELNDGAIYWREPTPIQSVSKIETRAGALIAVIVNFEIKGIYERTLAAVGFYNWTDGDDNLISDGDGNKIILRKK